MYFGERFNALTHLAGVFLALIGAAILITLALLGADWWKIASVTIYATSLVSVYGVSTLYHSLRGRAKRIFRKLDHESIYLLIAGTYTPFCLVTLRGPWGWSLFGIIWSLAALGMLQELWPRSEARILSLVIYTVMGWIALVALAPLLEALGPVGFSLVAAGGIIYTVGIIFYAFDERFRHWHGIWHLFVIGGSIAHYFAILFYVL